jgi:predicted permease
LPQPRRDQLAEFLMREFLHALRLAARSLQRSPGFTFAAVLALSLGIGLATAVHTVADALLLQRLPVREQERVVVLWGITRDRRFDNFPLRLSEVREFERRTRTLAQVAFFGYEGAWHVPVRDGERVFRMRRAHVSGTFFDVLGTRAALGRTLQPDDDVLGAAPVLVISHGAWQRYFGGDSAILGRSILMLNNGMTHQIVGVMPQGIEYPAGVEFWAPVIPGTAGSGIPTESPAFDLIGRLRPGASETHARIELDEYFDRPDRPTWPGELDAVSHTLPALIFGDTRPALLAFAAAALLLLLITCINVANLLLARGLDRVREVAVRTALGASRRRIALQLLLESTILAVLGGASGLLLASAAVRAFVHLAPDSIARLDSIRLDLRVLIAAGLITAIALIGFALAPALATSRAHLNTMLRSGSRQAGGGRPHRLITNTLVIGQIALALMILSAAAIVSRSLLALHQLDLAIRTEDLLIGELAVRYDVFDDRGKQIALLDRLLPAVRAIPGVHDVTPAHTVPFPGSGGIAGSLRREGQSADEGARNPLLNFEIAAPNYFATLGIPVLRGRSFTDDDAEGTARVLIISQSAARQYWPGQDPLGKHLQMGAEAQRTFTIVGVVPDTRYRDLRDTRGSVYFPLRQATFPSAPMTLALRITAQPAQVLPLLHRTIDQVDSGVTLLQVAPFEEFLAARRALPRLNALLLAAFAASALLLAAIGLFAVMATLVRQRRSELGVRMALGATAGNLHAHVLRHGLSLAATGTAIGLAAALLTNRLLTNLLFRVRPADAASLAAAALLLLAVAAAACVIPARASTRIPPSAALRGE